MCAVTFPFRGFDRVVNIIGASFDQAAFFRCWNYYIWLLVILRLLLPIHIDLGGSGGQVWGLFSKEETFQEKFSTTARTRAVILSLEKASKPWLDLLAGTGAVKGSIYSKPDHGQGEGKKAKASAGGYGSMQEGNIASSSVLPFSQPGIQLGLGICWLSGATFCLCVKARDYLGFVRRLKKECIPLSDLETANAVGQLSRRLSIKKQPSVCESGAVSVAMVVGLLQPAVVLPEGAREDPGLMSWSI